MPDEDLAQGLRDAADESARRWAARIGLDGALQESRVERLMRRAADRLDVAEGTLAGLVSGELDLGEVRAAWEATDARR